MNLPWSSQLVRSPRSRKTELGWKPGVSIRGSFCCPGALSPRSQASRSLRKLPSSGMSATLPLIAIGPNGQRSREFLNLAPNIQI